MRSAIVLKCRHCETTEKRLSGKAYELRGLSGPAGTCSGSCECGWVGTRRGPARSDPCESAEPGTGWRWPPSCCRLCRAPCRCSPRCPAGARAEGGLSAPPAAAYAGKAPRPILEDKDHAQVLKIAGAPRLQEALWPFSFWARHARSKYFCWKIHFYFN